MPNQRPSRRLEPAEEKANDLDIAVPSQGRILAQAQCRRHRRACVALQRFRHLVRRIQERIFWIQDGQWGLHCRRWSPVQGSIHLLDILRLMQQSYSTGLIAINGTNESCFIGLYPNWQREWSQTPFSEGSNPLRPTTFKDILRPVLQSYYIDRLAFNLKALYVASVPSGLACP